MPHNSGELEYVTAARGVGEREYRILFRHVLPNVLPTIIVAASFAIATALGAGAALSFLGLGVQPPTPSLGNMLSDAQSYIWNAPGLIVFPGFIVFMIVLGYCLVGGALCEVMDPTNLEEKR